MTNLSERVKKIISNEGISVNTMEKIIGASKGVLGRFLNQDTETDIQAKWLLMIAEKFPDYSADWLLRDEGPMLRNDDQTVNVFDGSGNNAVINGINNGTVEQHDTSQCPPCEQCPLLEAKNQVIEAQQGTIEAQRIAIDSLRR